MTELVHDAPGERFYEYGSSKAVLFPHTGGAYVWNGFQGVNINPVTQNESEKWYFDGVTYYEKIEAEEFGADIQCVNTPKAFLQCEGVYESTDYPGMYTHMNPRIKFNLAWVTQIGNDETEELGYRLHIVYNAQAQPAGRSYQTRTDISTPESRSISIKTTPACGIWSYYSFDSREADVDALLETILGGTLPSCDLLSVGPPPPPVEENDCINFIADFQGYNPGQILDEDIEESENNTEIILQGVVNNGLDTVTIPILGVDMADNDSAATPTIVGTGDVLSDDDDATYVTSGEGDLGYTFPIPLLTGGYAVGSRIELHIRMSIDGLINPDDPDNLAAEAQVHISTDVEGELTIGGFSDGAQEGMAFKLIDVVGTPVDYVIPLRMDAWINSTEADVVAALEAGAFMNFLGASNFNSDPAELPVEVRVYDAKIVIINTTDGDRYLRPDPVTGVGVAEQHIRTTFGGSTDVESAFTTFVDFKVKSVPEDDTYDGVSQNVIEFDGGDVGVLAVEVVSTVARAAWYDDGSTIADVAFNLTPEVWYRARLYWTWGAANIKVWVRDSSLVSYLIDRNMTPSTTPTAQVTHNAGFVGE